MVLEVSCGVGVGYGSGLVLGVGSGVGYGSGVASVIFYIIKVCLIEVRSIHGIFHFMIEVRSDGVSTLNHQY